MSEQRPTEDDLREMFAGSPANNSLDASRIVARSRARRLPRVLGAAAAGTLVVAGIATVAVQASLLPQGVSTSSLEESAGDSAESEAVAPVEQKRAPADRINLCEAQVTDIPASSTGLQLDVEFAQTAAVGTQPIVGTVRLTNTSDQTVSGTTAASPALTLSRDGTVVWHSNGPTILSLVVVELEPGASLEYQASFTPVLCSVADDLAEGFPADLPALEPGVYELSALIDFASATPTNGTTELDLISGPRSTVTLG